jgi:hypothetical protein
MPSLKLNGEGVFEAVHALLQVLNLPFLLPQEEVFDPVKSFRHLLVERLDLHVQCLHDLLVRHMDIDHRRKFFNGDW